MKELMFATFAGLVLLLSSFALLCFVGVALIK